MIQKSQDEESHKVTSKMVNSCAGLLICATLCILISLKKAKKTRPMHKIIFLILNKQK